VLRRALRRRDFIKDGMGIAALAAFPWKAAFAPPANAKPGGGRDHDEVIRVLNRCGMEFGGIEVGSPRRHHGHI
jgi:hypothetical protein